MLKIRLAANETMRGELQRSGSDEQRSEYWIQAHGALLDGSFAQDDAVNCGHYDRRPSEGATSKTHIAASVDLLQLDSVFCPSFFKKASSAACMYSVPNDALNSKGRQ